MLCSAWQTADAATIKCPAGDTWYDHGLLLASWVLYHLTGRRWPGTCSETIRPCADDRCTCRRSHREVRLPGTPVTAVSDVSIEGVSLAASAYQVFDREWLARVDGDYWPCCQDWTETAGAEDTWSITYSWGSAPPAPGLRAVELLGCEYAKAMAGPDCTDCGPNVLSQRVQQISRQGVNLTVDDPAVLAEQGRTGHPLVDTWVESLNLGETRRRGRVYDLSKVGATRREVP